MKEQLKQIQQDFEDIMFSIEDLKNITMIFQEFMWHNGTTGMGKMQNMLNVQLCLLKKIEQDCLKLDEKFEVL